jgi:lipid-binding SYLF domain-containing protein
VVGVGVGVRVSVRCREFIIMINSKFAANLSHYDKFGRV